jgi:hypothetical protein
MSASFPSGNDDGNLLSALSPMNANAQSFKHEFSRFGF